MTDTDLVLESASRMSRDLRAAAATLTATEARYLVDTYYQMQKDRIRSANQVRALRAQEEPHATVAWLSDQAGILERNVKAALGVYASAHLVGRWAQSIVGIGPILAAGLLAHLDITKAPTVGHIWRFAGLDPTVAWDRGTKRPWNASLKTLCWKMGESFVKVSGHEEDIYGHVYLQRKAVEQAHNDAGDLAAQAATKLERFKIGKGTEAYAAYTTGRLPPAHLHARAKRYAVKLFLAHWHAVAYRAQHGTEAPKPYVLTQLQHAHEIVCPHWPF
jgi:hypothetical protein